MPAINRIGYQNGFYKSLGCGLAALLLLACTTPQPPVPKTVFDFGPVLTAAASASPARHVPLALPEIEAAAGLDSPAMIYRLVYSDAQQLRPYAQARWSVPPAQLVRARLRDALALQGSVMPQEGTTLWTMRVELDEFSHVYDSPDSSQGVVRLRASLLQAEKLVAQTTVLARAKAPSQNAAGGVKALMLACDDAVLQLVNWSSSYLKP